jgi:regulator of protease activity HflC (stomatin/prohibitin superfamily)
MDIIGYTLLGLLGLTILSGIRIIRPTERGVRETLGKYTGYTEAGFNYVIPFFQRIHRINVTENMVNVEPQDIITKDNLNAKVDLVVFYRILEDEKNVKNAFYNVNDVEGQIVTLAQTTARNVIGSMVFRDVNSKRNELNANLAKVIDKQTTDWGVKIVRVELKEIAPPRDVQETMNKVIKAENEKESAIDFATARETEADGIKRAKIKEAEGQKQFSILVAEGQAKAFDLVNKSFKGNAQKLKQLEVTENSLKNGSKIVLGQNGKDILKLLNIDK